MKSVLTRASSPTGPPPSRIFAVIDVALASQGVAAWSTNHGRWIGADAIAVAAYQAAEFWSVDPAEVDHLVLPCFSAFGTQAVEHINRYVVAD